MAWAEPLYSKTLVNEAGRLLANWRTADDDQVDAALEILSNWRSSHSFPLNTMQMGLRSRATRVESDALVAQRLKRVPSMVQKLSRYPKMQLTRMQDIGGCRAVLSSVDAVRAVSYLFHESRMKHTLVREDDYIGSPKTSGYRGVHLVYRYFSDRSHTYNGLQIEVQVRSLLQHAWATAVETVGTFLDQALKSSEGSDQWLEFFALVGSAFALLETTPVVPGTPATSAELRSRIAGFVEALNVTSTLEAYGEALRTVEEPTSRDTRYYLLILQPANEVLEIRGYKAVELPTATAEYLETERQLRATSGGQAVLVAAESLDALRRSYPNYFLDTQVFLHHLREFLQ